MKKVLLAVLAVAIGFIFVSSQAFAISKEYQRKGVQVEQGGKDAEPYKDPAQKDAEGYEKGDFHKKVKVSDFPEKGWHKGPYVGLNVGLLQVSNDEHIVTGRNFGSWENLGFGLTFGWDIADWIGPMLQMTYSTKSAQVGDSNGGNNGGAAYPSNPGVTFPAGTFPTEQAKEHVVDVSVFAKATLPYFTRADWQFKMVKILPYAKLGATVHALYVNAPTAANKSGAVGGGPAVGVGCEFLIWKGFFASLDFTEHLILQKAFSKNITTTAGVQSFKVTKGGFNPHFALMGIFGWHF